MPKHVLLLNRVKPSGEHLHLWHQAGLTLALLAEIVAVLFATILLVLWGSLKRCGKGRGSRQDSQLVLV